MSKDYTIIGILIILALALNPNNLTSDNVLAQTSEGEFLYFNTHIRLDINGSSDWSLTALFHNTLNRPASELVIILPYVIEDVNARVNGSDTVLLSEISNDQTTLTMTFIDLIPVDEFALLSISGLLSADMSEIEDNLYQYTQKWHTNYFCNNYSISITLPTGSSIDPSGEGLVFPRNSRYSTDGDRITVIWERLEYTSVNDDNEVIIQFLYAPVIQEGDGVSFSALFITLLMGLLIGSSALFLYYRSKFEEIEERSKNQTKVVEKVRPVLLSPNEIEVLKLINENDGGIKQADLVTLLNVTKARVSQYLTKLEELGFIKKSKMGRQNYIILEQHVVLDFEATSGDTDE